MPVCVCVECKVLKLVVSLVCIKFFGKRLSLSLPSHHFPFKNGQKRRVSGIMLASVVVFPFPTFLFGNIFRLCFM